MPSYVRGRERGRTLSDELIAQAYASGETADSIAQRAQCCCATVLEIVRKAGIEARRPGKGAPRQRLIGDDEIIRRYRAGEPGPRLADAAGCTPGTVYRILRTYDVPVRPSATRNGGRKKTYGGRLDHGDG